VAETTPGSEGTPPTPLPAPQPPSAGLHVPPHREIHEVTFVTYPKLLFIWPIIVAGFAFWLPGYGAQAPAATATGAPATTAAPSPGASGQPVAAASSAGVSPRLEVLGWLYIFTFALVLLTLGVDVDRNMAIFLVILTALLWVLGMYLRDVKHFTFFGDIYRWFANLNVQYDRSLGLALSIILLVPYVLMLGWARLNDRWRITHNEFEHRAWGKSDDSLGRGAKTIRASYPDVFELLLGLAGTLTVYNANGTQELRRIPHVMFLPIVRQRLGKILETTSITVGQAEDEEEDGST